MKSTHNPLTCLSSFTFDEIYDVVRSVDKVQRNKTTNLITEAHIRRLISIYDRFHKEGSATSNYSYQCIPYYGPQFALRAPYKPPKVTILWLTPLRGGHAARRDCVEAPDKNREHHFFVFNGEGELVYAE